jgi:hypothetical protein
MTVINRFDKMFLEHGIEERTTPPPPVKKRKGDFNEIMRGDTSFAAAMQNVKAALVPPALSIDETDSKPAVSENQLPEQPYSQPVQQTFTQPQSHPDNQPLSQPDAQPVKQPYEQPKRQPQEQPINQTDSQPKEQLSVQTLNQPSNPSSNLSDRQATLEPTSKPTRQPVNRPVSQTPGQIANRTANQPMKSALSDSDLAVMAVSKAQGIILIFLSHQPGVTQKQRILEATQLPIGTLKDSLRSLKQLGFIVTETFIMGDYRGFSFTINVELFNHFVAQRGREFSSLSSFEIQPLSHPYNQTDRQPIGQPHKQPDDLSLVVVEPEKTTTTVLTGPEMAYWVELGLKDRQVLKWCEDFNIDPTEIRQQLAWARWDLVNNDKEAEVKKDAINWFFGILKRSAGCYPPAKGYQSPAMIRAARLREQIDAEAKARAELDTLEAEVRFQVVLNNPEGAEYQKLLSGLPEAMSGIKGRALETILRERFLAREG